MPNDIQRIVDDPEWQALRRSLVGTWKLWAKENTEVLRVYLGDMKDELKLRRVHNYLTGSAFRIGIIQHSEITALLEQVRKARGKA